MSELSRTLLTESRIWLIVDDGKATQAKVWHIPAANYEWMWHEPLLWVAI